MKSLKFGVVGNPIRHSRSPEIHHHFADQQKIKISFGKYLVDMIPECNIKKNTRDGLNPGFS